jgi:hypothetical protein
VQVGVYKMVPGRRDWLLKRMSMCLGYFEASPGSAGGEEDGKSEWGGGSCSMWRPQGYSALEHNTRSAQAG